ncbi:MAG TPA: beta-ketoacyl-[acyl-carrier-protein] synthase family protein [Euzebya sp.]|nr:beta-ketoacyl-[acyl-carrier-protein] synthase family protein [Euzebya sp.]
MNRVVITGIGAVTPLGNDAETTWQHLRDGVSGVGRISTFDPTGFPVRIGGMVKDFTLDPHLANPSQRRHLNRPGEFGLAAAAEALRASGVQGSGAYEPWEKGISVAGSVGRPSVAEIGDMAHEMSPAGGAGAIARAAPADVLRNSQNMAALQIARVADCEGPMRCVSTACAGAAHAVGEALRMVQHDDAACVVAGGYDALTEWLDVIGFGLLGALTTEHDDHPEKASRPFAVDRAGFVIGEGAVMVVVEREDRALARGAPILAELAGYGTSLNAYRITDAPPSGEGPDVAMRAALRDAGMAPTDIDHIAVHGTGTPGNDPSETNAIKAVFGAHAEHLLLSSGKSMTGHLTGAAAGLGLLGAVRAITDGVVHPTINLDVPDPACDLDYVPHVAREALVRAALVHAFAFGGTNAVLAVRAHGGEET